MFIDEHLKFEDDKLYHYYPLPQYGDGICKKDLVMTKEIFIECYKRWIEPQDKTIPSEEQKKCKDCKWWRDSDGAYRRGVKAESRCPINTVSVANGWGYCYMFEPQESEDKK